MNSVSIILGEYYATDKDLIIHTVLGSCISACLFTDSSKFTGMNHFMLPNNPTKQSIPSDKRGLYGINSMELLIAEFIKQGINRKDLKAKIYGGGNTPDVSDKNNVAENNINFIIEYLRTENIPVVSSDLGGNSGREILYFTGSREVKIKLLPKVNFEEIRKKEKEYQEEFERIMNVPPDITIY